MFATKEFGFFCRNSRITQVQGPIALIPKSLPLDGVCLFRFDHDTILKKLSRIVAMGIIVNRAEGLVVVVLGIRMVW